LSREQQEAELLSGRLDPDRLRRLLPALVPVDTVDQWFLCGPFAMVEGAMEVLGPYFEQTIPNRIKHLEADPDMDPIRDDPRFVTMLAAAKQRLGMGA